MNESFNDLSEVQLKELLQVKDSQEFLQKAKLMGIEVPQNDVDEIFSNLKNAEKVSSKLKKLSTSDQKKIESLLSDSKDPSEVINAFKSVGIEINEKVAQSVLKSRTEGTELSDEDLDQVAGGGWFLGFWAGTIVGDFFKSLF